MGLRFPDGRSRREAVIETATVDIAGLVETCRSRSGYADVERTKRGYGSQRGPYSEQGWSETARQGSDSFHRPITHWAG